MTDRPATLEEIQGHLDAARSLCGSLDPSVLGDAEVPAAFDALAATQRLIEGAVVRMTARYEEAQAWKRSGSKSAEDVIARKTGTSTSRARKQLDTSKRLRRRPKSDAAVRAGALSPDQADEVTSGADASPDDEDSLLASARKDPLHELRRKAADARAKADRDREATRRRQHRNRRVSRWRDSEGMYNLHLRGPADWGAEIDAALKPGIDRAFADARDAGRFEPVDAYAADVVRQRLLGAVDGAAPAGSGNRAVRPERKVIALVDLAALNRGHTVDGEIAQIAGVGPVSVSAIRAMLADAFVSVVFTDGVDVRNVTHLGRQVTAHQRTALEARGYRCEIEGCGATHQLEIDHVTGWALTRRTRLDDLAWLCPHHHRLKTRRRLHLAGPTGARQLVVPDPNGNDPPPGPSSGVSIQDDLFTTVV